MLLAAIGGGRRVAIPLDTVTRLEQVRTDSVEKVGNREVVQYRGAILPIVRLDRHLGAYGETDREVLEVIVYADHGRSVAIVVEEILDIVDGEAAVRSDIDDLGLLGSAVLGDKVDRAARRPRRDPRRRPGVLHRPRDPDPVDASTSPPLCWRSDRDRTRPTSRRPPPAAARHLPARRRPVRHRGRARAGGAAQPAADPGAAGARRRRRPDQPARPGRHRDRAARAARPRRRGPRAPTPSSSSSGCTARPSACSSTRSPTSSTSTPSDFEAPPDTLEGQARDLIRGAYKLDGQLLLALDVQKAVSA